MNININMNYKHETIYIISVSKCKAIQYYIGRGNLKGCLILMIPHCLGNRLTDGGKVSFTHRSRSIPHKYFLVFPRYSFLLEAE
jgi:hypothetical protein